MKPQRKRGVGKLKAKKSFPAEVSEQLHSYVYVYVDPRNSEPFYVGKGLRDRAFAHLDESGESRKLNRIAEIRGAGHEPRIEILRYGLNEDEASLVEAAVIDFARDRLTNEQGGNHSDSFGRIRLDELLLSLTAEPAKIQHPVLLITINRLYRSDMPDVELLEATRGIWRLGDRRAGAKFGLSVFRGIVREVYRIHRWLPAGTLQYRTRDSKAFKGSGRWEFEGSRAEADVRDRYLGKSVRRYQAKNRRRETHYVGC